MLQNYLFFSDSFHIVSKLKALVAVPRENFEGVGHSN